MDLLPDMNWFAVGQIILIDLLLGGDNAIVIALACRKLPEKLRRCGILLGTLGAIALRIALITFAVTLLQLPFLKLFGGALLFRIGIKLLSEEDDGHTDIHGSNRLISAVKTIVVADLVMSIDNVIAVASAAEHAGGEHRMLLVVFGILVSVPVIVWGSTVVLKLMERLPVIVSFGAGLLGYLAGAMAAGDAALASRLGADFSSADVFLPGTGLHFSIPGLAAGLLVVLLGKQRRSRQAQARRESAAPAGRPSNRSNPE